jgi:hypothetical protein
MTTNSVVQNDSKSKEEAGIKLKNEAKTFNNLNLNFVHSLQQLFDEKIDQRLSDQDCRVRKEALQDMKKISIACKKSGGFGIVSDNSSRRLIKLLQDSAKRSKYRSPSDCDNCNR